MICNYEYYYFRAQLSFMSILLVSINYISILNAQQKRGKSEKKNPKENIYICAIVKWVNLPSTNLALSVFHQRRFEPLRMCHESRRRCVWTTHFSLLMLRTFLSLHSCPFNNLNCTLASLSRAYSGSSPSGWGRKPSQLRCVPSSDSHVNFEIEKIF